MLSQKQNRFPQLTIYYSYACRDSYLLFRLLRQVRAECEPLEITWNPFAIEIDNNPDYWGQPWEQASSELRGFIAAAAARRQGERAFQFFHEALEAAVHEQLLELRDESTLIGAAERASLDLERFRSGWHDPALALEARRSHENAIRKYGISGTPTILFPNGRALHIELVEEIRLERALEVFDDIAGLGYEYLYFSKADFLFEKN